MGRRLFFLKIVLLTTCAGLLMVKKHEKRYSFAYFTRVKPLIACTIKLAGVTESQQENTISVHDDF